MDGRVDLARTAAVIAALAPDVVCLQELAVHQPGLPGGADEDQPARLRQLLPGYESAFAAGSDLPDGQGGRRQFGVMILARRPLLQVLRHQLPWPADPAVPSMPRVALEAVVDLPAGPLRVVTTHLEYYSAVQRTAQVEALRQIQAEGHRHGLVSRSSAETDPPFAVLPRGRRAVFCGDFNFSPESADYRRLQSTIAADVPSLVDAWSLAHPGTAHAPTAGVHGAGFTPAPLCCDFCFVSENLVVSDMAVSAATDASDHQPVLLTLLAR
jgi:endonuclease/exonuclease/phosphatase family metal-dependent hydrolase